MTLHSLGSLDSDKVQAARDHGLCRATQREPERLLVGSEHLHFVVEAVEVVGDLDRVGRDPLRPALLRRLADDVRELGEPLDQLALLRLQRLRSVARLARRVAEDPRDPRVRVLDVVDRVLGRLLGGEVDVDVDRLVGAAVDEVPARRVDADLVDEVVEEDDVAAASTSSSARRRESGGRAGRGAPRRARGRSRACPRLPSSARRTRGGRRRARRSRGRSCSSLRRR